MRESIRTYRVSNAYYSNTVDVRQGFGRIFYPAVVEDGTHPPLLQGRRQMANWFRYWRHCGWTIERVGERVVRA